MSAHEISKQMNISRSNVEKWCSRTNRESILERKNYSSSNSSSSNSINELNSQDYDDVNNHSILDNLLNTNQINNDQDRSHKKIKLDNNICYDYSSNLVSNTILKNQTSDSNINSNNYLRQFTDLIPDPNILDNNYNESFNNNLLYKQMFANQILYNSSVNPSLTSNQAFSINYSYEYSNNIIGNNNNTNRNFGNINSINTIPMNNIHANICNPIMMYPQLYPQFSPTLIRSVDILNSNSNSNSNELNYKENVKENVKQAHEFEDLRLEYLLNNSNIKEEEERIVMKLFGALKKIPTVPEEKDNINLLLQDNREKYVLQDNEEIVDNEVKKEKK